MISRVGRVGLVRVITCMEDVFHKIYTNSEINIQNIKLISSHPFLFHRECYLQWRSHIELWHVHVFGSYFSFETLRVDLWRQAVKKGEMSIISLFSLTILMHTKKNTREWGREWRPFNPWEVYSHGLCPCTPYWKNLWERGCLKGLVVAKLVISSF